MGVIQALRGGEERIGEHLVMKKDGSTFVVEAHRHIILRNGKIVRLTVIWNIIKLKRAKIIIRVIVMAEYNPSNQKVLMEMPRRSGYRADAVSDGHGN